jgi:DNA-directed RNA polymerase subunit RPC12/RpoP
MSSLINTDIEGNQYHQDNLIKFRCYHCGNEFIIGEFLSKDTKKITCPFCGCSESVEWVSKYNEEELEELELGEVGIYYYKDSDGHVIKDPFFEIEKEMFEIRKNRKEVIADE